MKVARVLALLSLFSLGTFACDKPEPAADKPAPSAPASVSAPTSAPSASAVPIATATASASAAPASAAPTKDAVASVFDPVKEPARTVKALAGGTVALYLPEWAGTSWKITQPDKALGRAKEETIPGFAGPSTPAHAFTWQVGAPLKGQVHKITLTNTGKGSPSGHDVSFTLSIDVS
jgi:hypothetical protein